TAMLERAGVPPERRRLERTVDARYVRQSYELAVPLAEGAITAATIEQLAEAYHDRHRLTYGHDNRSEPVQIVNVRVTAVGQIPALKMRQEPAVAGTDPVKSERVIWFRKMGEQPAPVLERTQMPAGYSTVGPSIIESLESTIVVPPGWQARMDEDGYVHLTRTEQAGG
ncbi:MAG: hypothetical protein ACR2OV_17250, partial [Hyphomicrobiaceae bacterium]